MALLSCGRLMLYKIQQFASRGIAQRNKSLVVFLCQSVLSQRALMANMLIWAVLWLIQLLQAHLLKKQNKEARGDCHTDSGLSAVANFRPARGHLSSAPESRYGRGSAYTPAVWPQAVSAWRQAVCCFDTENKDRSGDRKREGGKE